VNRLEVNIQDVYEWAQTFNRPSLFL